MALCVRKALHADLGSLDGEDTKSSLSWQCDQTEKVPLGYVPRSSLRFCSTAFTIPASTMVAASLLDRTATTFGICRRGDGGLRGGWFLRADGNNFKRVGPGGAIGREAASGPISSWCQSFVLVLCCRPDYRFLLARKHWKRGFSFREQPVGQGPAPWGGALVVLSPEMAGGQPLNF